MRITAFKSILLLLGSCVLLPIIAHATAYLTHEYAHTLSAWLLGWMSGPFDIDYGRPTLGNLILLGDVSDNVNYAPMFATGHGITAATIALAGPLLGNGVLYVLVALTYRLGRNQRFLRMTCFWLALMCAANMWSYVPLRTLTTHADIALAAQGFGVSDWTMLLCLLPLTLLIAGHFFLRIMPAENAAMAARSESVRIALVATAAMWFFYFFAGDAAAGQYGVASQIMGLASRYVLMPLAVAWFAKRQREGAHGVVLNK